MKDNSLTSNQTLGPPDHLCPKCGEYVMCDNDAAIERLTRDLDETVKALNDCVSQSGEELQDMLKDNERLRAALERVRDEYNSAAWAGAVDGDTARAMLNHAREALRPADETRGMQTGKTAREVAEREAHDKRPAEEGKS